MKLMTKTVQKALPALYSQDGKGDDAIVHAKFFTPWSNWTWFVMETDGDLCFGIVEGHETEYGYFTVSELAAVKGPMGLTIERDIHWKAETVGSLKAAGIIKL